jgi:hypothetical protein
MGGESKCGIEVPSLLYFSNPHFRSRLALFRRSNLPTSLLSFSQLFIFLLNLKKLRFEFS